MISALMVLLIGKNAFHVIPKSKFIIMKQTFTLPTRSLSQDKKTAYINARLFDPESGLDSHGTLLTQGSVIADFGVNITVPEGAEVIRLQRPFAYAWIIGHSSAFS